MAAFETERSGVRVGSLSKPLPKIRVRFSEWGAGEEAGDLRNYDCVVPCESWANPECKSHEISVFDLDKFYKRISKNVNN